VEFIPTIQTEDGGDEPHPTAQNHANGIPAT